MDTGKWIEIKSQTVVAHPFNPSTWKAEVSESL